MQQVKVKAKDVMLPFVILFIANFAVLLAWTLVEPLRWQRVEVANYDQFGRSVESYGTCFAPDQSGHFLEVSSRKSNSFVVALGVFNFVAVIFANYQCYLSRQVPSDFNESYYIALSMLSILEGFLIGTPILFLVIGKPSSGFVVASVLIAFLCMAILVPMFGSKVFTKRRSRLNRSEWNQTWRNFDLPAADSAGRSRRDSSYRSTTAVSHRDSVAAIRERVARRASLAQSALQIESPREESALN